MENYVLVQKISAIGLNRIKFVIDYANYISFGNDHENYISIRCFCKKVNESCCLLK